MIISSFILLGMVLTLSAKMIELREFKLRPAKGHKPLSEKQIINALDHNSLGLDQVIKIPLNKGTFLFSNVKPYKYPSEYHKDFFPAKFAIRDLGISIEGTSKRLDGKTVINLSYKHISKTEDVIFATLENRATLMPIFKSLSIPKTKFIIDPIISQWAIVPIPVVDSNTQHYIAFRVNE